MSIVNVPILHSYQQCTIVHFPPRPHQHLLSLAFLMIDVLKGVRRHLTVVLIHISIKLVMLSIFSCNYWSFEYLLGKKCLFTSFAHFLIRLYYFFLFIDTLNRSGDCGLYSLVPDLGGKASKPLLQSMTPMIQHWELVFSRRLAGGLSFMYFIMLNYSPSTPSFFRVFIMNICSFCQMIFLLLMRS